MKLRESCKYAIACPSSMGVRITPENRMAVHNSNLFYLQSTSADSGFGLRAARVWNDRAGGKDLKTKIENFKGMIREVQAKYSNASVFATTLREVVSANRNLWGAIMLAEGQWYVEEPREIDILDRIGGGDGFTGGLLYGVWKGWEPQKWVQFGWATGALAASSLNDYAEPADEAQVWAIYAGNARVQR